MLGFAGWSPVALCLHPQAHVGEQHSLVPATCGQLAEVPLPVRASRCPWAVTQRGMWPLGSACRPHPFWIYVCSTRPPRLCCFLLAPALPPKERKWRRASPGQGSRRGAAVAAVCGAGRGSQGWCWIGAPVGGGLVGRGPTAPFAAGCRAVKRPPRPAQTFPRRWLGASVSGLCRLRVNPPTELFLLQARRTRGGEKRTEPGNCIRVPCSCRIPGVLRKGRQCRARHLHLEPPSRVPCVPRAQGTTSETHTNTCPENQRVPWFSLGFVSLAFQKSCFLTTTRKSGLRFGVFLIV